MEAPCSVDIPMELSEFGVLAVTSLSHLFALSLSLVVFFYLSHFCFVNKLRFCNNVLFYVNSRFRSFLLFVRDLTVF